MGYDKTYIFTRLGKAVKKHNTVSAHPGGFAPVLDALLEETIGVFNDSDEDRRLLALFSGANRSDQAAFEAMKNQLVSTAASFLTNDLRERLGVVSATGADVLAALRDAMQDASDTVLETLSVATASAYDNDNTGNGTLSAITLDQMARDSNHFECECIDDTTSGEERWRVTSSRLGYVGEATTDDEFDASEENTDGNVEAGVKFTINQAAGSSAEDWDVGDKIRFSTHVQPAFTESGDDSSQLASWKFFNVILGVNTSSDKKLYVTLTAAGSPETYTISLYKDASKTELVAQGTSDEASATVTLDEKNGSGLSGEVAMAYTTDDSDVVVTFTNRARFQYFLVEQFSRAMPGASSGANTVNESLAE